MDRGAAHDPSSEIDDKPGYGERKRVGTTRFDGRIIEKGMYAIHVRAFIIRYFTTGRRREEKQNEGMERRMHL